MTDFTLKTPTQEPDLATAMQVVYQWDYDPTVEELRNVKAAEAQWIGDKALDWSRPIDLQKFATTPLGAGIPLEKTEDSAHKGGICPDLVLRASTTPLVAP